MTDPNQNQFSSEFQRINGLYQTGAIDDVTATNEILDLISQVEEGHIPLTSGENAALSQELDDFGFLNDLNINGLG